MKIIFMKKQSTYYKPHHILWDSYVTSTILGAMSIGVFLLLKFY